MRKIIITFMACVMVVPSFSQENDSIPKVESIPASEFKQSQGEKTFELGFDPGAIFNSSNGGSVLGIQTDFGIRYRKFKSASKAFRMGLDVSFLNYVEVTQQKDNFGSRELKDKGTTIGFVFRPGFENHFKGTNRLSPYIGGEGIIGFQTSTFKSEVQVGSSIDEYKYRNGNPDDGILLGFGAVAGVDYYIVKKLYLGLELNYSIVYFNQATEKTFDLNGNEDEYNNGSMVRFGPGSIAIFRIGYLFSN